MREVVVVVKVGEAALLLRVLEEGCEVAGGVCVWWLVGRPNFQPCQWTRALAVMCPEVMVSALAMRDMPRVCWTSSMRVERAKTRSMGAWMVVASVMVCVLIEVYFRMALFAGMDGWRAALA